MPLQIQKVQVWTGRIENLLGAAAAKLEQLAHAGADLQLVFTRPAPDNPDAGVLFLAPIQGAAQMQAARLIGLQPAQEVTMLFIQGPNRPGIGYELMSQLAVAGVPLRGFSIAAAGAGFGAYLAFDDPDAATLAIQVLAQVDA